MQIGYEVFHRDVGVLVDFYVEVLGFVAPSGTGPDHVRVRRGDVGVGCTRWDGADAADGSPRRPPAGSEIVLRVEDVRAELERVEASGWPVADPLEERPWGSTDFRIFDPSGQYLRITS